MVVPLGTVTVVRSTGRGPTATDPVFVRNATSSIETLFDPLLATKADFPSLVMAIAVGSVPTGISATLLFVKRSRTTTLFAPDAPSTIKAYRPSGVTATDRAGKPTLIVSRTV